MRIIILAIALMMLTEAAAGQTPQSPPPATPEPAQSDSQITHREISNLSIIGHASHGKPPVLPLKRALKLAKHHIKNAQIDISPYYLREARLIYIEVEA